MKIVARYGTAVVLVHLFVTTLHGTAHANLQIGLTTAQKLFVLLVINVLPLLAMALLWTRYQRAGCVLLSASMFASMLFGVWNHFVVSGPDHVAHVASGPAGLLFQITAVLLAITEAAGAWLGFAWFRSRAANQTLS
jgi:hypothetical protein